MTSKIKPGFYWHKTMGLTYLFIEKSSSEILAEREHEIRQKINENGYSPISDWSISRCTPMTNNQVREYLEKLDKSKKGTDLVEKWVQKRLESISM